MGKLPQLSGRECIRALAKVGFYRVRQEASHVILRRDDPFAQVTVPDHKRLKPGTLRSIIRQSGFSVDEFIELL